MDLRRILLTVVVVTLLVSSVGAVGVFAQTGGAPDVGNGTNETGDSSEAPAVPGSGGSGSSAGTGGTGGTNETGAGNGTAVNAGGGGGGGGPVAVAQGVLDAGTNAATGGAQAAADAALGPVFVFVLDIPTIDIGLTDSPGLHAPTGQPYEVLFPVLYVGIAVPITAVSFGIITFASFGTAPIASFPHIPGSTYGALSRGVRAFLAILGGIAFHLVAFSIVHELFAGFAEQVAPSPGEMIAEMGLLQFSLATAFTGMGLYEMGWDILKWIGLIYAIIWIYIAFFPMISMPFTAAWLYAPRSTLGKFSGYLHVTHLALLFSKAAVAVQLFAAAQLDWGASFDGIVAAFVSLGLIATALATPPLLLIFMWLSKGRMIAAIGAGAGAAAGSSAVAATVREKNPVDTEQVKERGKGYAKRKGAAAQGKYWDVKNRSAALASVARGSATGAAYAGKDRLDRWRSDEPGADSSSKTATDGERSPTRSERMRRFEELNDRAGGLSTSQRKRYFHLKMEEQGAFDSGLGNSSSERKHE